MIQQGKTPPTDEDAIVEAIEQPFDSAERSAVTLNGETPVVASDFTLKLKRRKTGRLRVF